MTEIKGLTTNLSEEFPQGGTGVHMAPAFRGFLGELDDRHSRLCFPRPGLFPGPTDTMAGDSLSLGELCFDLPPKVSDDRWAEKVRIIHPFVFTCLNHLNVNLLSILLFREIERAYGLSGFI